MSSRRAGRSKEGRSERKLASRIREEGGVNRHRSSLLVPAPLFISEGVVYPHLPPRGALELGQLHFVVVPWRRPTLLGPYSAVRGQCELAPSIALVGDISIHPAEQQRTKRNAGRVAGDQSLNHHPPVGSLQAHFSRAVAGLPAPAVKSSMVTEDWSKADILTRENLSNR